MIDLQIAETLIGHLYILKKRSIFSFHMIDKFQQLIIPRLTIRK